MLNLKDQLTQSQVKHFLTLPGERLIIAKRQHWAVLIMPLLLILCIGSVSFPLSYVVFVQYLQDALLFVAGSFLIVAVMTTFIIHRLIDWCFHIYILTDRKILEVSFVPMFSQVINDVFLDQVRTTEIDIKIDNFVNEFLDVGDVVIEFDRPSHDERFTLKDIKSPRRTGILIADALESIMHQIPVWFHPRDINRGVRVTDE